MADLKVFLCHSSSDKPAVRSLCQQVRKEGFIDPWLDEEKLLPGQDWELEIQKAVRAANVVVVCLSSTSVTRAGFAQKEIKYALDVADEQPEGTIFIIPLRLEDCEVPYRLRRWHWVDLFAERGYQRLIDALRTRSNEIGASAGLDTELTRSTTNRADTPKGFEDFRLHHLGTSSNIPDYSEGYWEVQIITPATIFNVSAVAWHPQATILQTQDLGQISGKSKGTLKLRVQWMSNGTPPATLEDNKGRKFPRNRPRDQGHEWEPLYVTFESEDGVWAAVTYFKVTKHSKGFPVAEKIPGDAPYGWISLDNNPSANPVFDTINPRHPARTRKLTLPKRTGTAYITDEYGEHARPTYDLEALRELHPLLATAVSEVGTNTQERLEMIRTAFIEEGWPNEEFHWTIEEFAAHYDIPNFL